VHTVTEKNDYSGFDLGKLEKNILSSH